MVMKFFATIFLFHNHISNEKQSFDKMPRGSPEWLAAKQLLEQDYRSVQNIDTMTPEQVIALRPGIYGKVPKRNFVNNWNAMKARMKANQDQAAQGQQGQKKVASGPSAWEIAKPLLEQDYLSGTATAEMTTEEVIALRPTIYGKVPRANFVNNWRALKKRVDEDKERAKKNRERYDHDVAIYTLAKDCPWEWHGSDAEKLLKKDIKKGRHLRYHPSLLYVKRAAYGEFDYEVFKKHVHQEGRSSLETPYWMVQKEKKEKKKKEIKEAVEHALEEAKLDELGDAFAGLNIN